MHKRPLIALADDNAATRILLNEVLNDHGYQTICCSSGAEVYQVIRTTTPDLVLMDMHMERSNAGMLVLEQLRDRPETAHIPVFLYSDDKQALRAQASDIRNRRSDIVEEIFDLDGLVSKLDRAIRVSVER